MEFVWDLGRVGGRSCVPERESARHCSENVAAEVHAKHVFVDAPWPAVGLTHFPQLFLVFPQIFSVAPVWSGLTRDGLRL